MTLQRSRALVFRLASGSTDRHVSLGAKVLAKAKVEIPRMLKNVRFTIVLERCENSLLCQHECTLALVPALCNDTEAHKLHVIYVAVAAAAAAAALGLKRRCLLPSVAVLRLQT